MTSTHRAHPSPHRARGRRLAQVPLQDRKPAGAALRPAVMGPTGGVSTGHPLTTAAAFGILLKGGNAFDAGVASLLAGGVLEQDLYSLGGEALVLVYPVKERKVTAIVGQGWAPKAVDVDWYLSRNKSLEGEGLDPAVVPGALHGALTVLERWGTMSFEEVAAPAIAYARDGFPMRDSTARAVRNQRGFFERWPKNKAYWLKPDGIGVPARRDDKAPDARAHARAHGRRPNAARNPGDGPRASRPRAIDSTRATSRRRWWRSSRSTGRPSTSPTSRSSSPASKSRPVRPIAATPSTSTVSEARVRCCCRR